MGISTLVTPEGAGGLQDCTLHTEGSPKRHAGGPEEEATAAAPAPLPPCLPRRARHSRDPPARSNSIRPSALIVSSAATAGGILVDDWWKQGYRTQVLRLVK